MKDMIERVKNCNQCEAHIEHTNKLGPCHTCVYCGSMGEMSVYGIIVCGDHIRMLKLYVKAEAEQKSTINYDHDAWSDLNPPHRSKIFG